jgi:hypothetical protein
MSNELKLLSTKVTAGTMTRREFMSKAAALGVTAAVASTILADAAYAAGPVKGGTFRMGVSGGESTNSQDPATWASDAPLAGGFIWAKLLFTLVQMVSNQKLLKAGRAPTPQKLGVSKSAKVLHSLTAQQ